MTVDARGNKRRCPTSRLTESHRSATTSKMRPEAKTSATRLGATAPLGYLESNEDEADTPKIPMPHSHKDGPPIETNA
jgi:hypothetical protein